jgi:hypothetical protein
MVALVFLGVTLLVQALLAGISPQRNICLLRLLRNSKDR